MSEQKFRIRTKHISLDFMGEEWTDAYIETRYLFIEDVNKIEEAAKGIGNDNLKAMESMREVVIQQFYSGMAPSTSGELAAVTSADIPFIFDSQAIMEIYGQIMGKPSPKASESSMTSTPAEPTSNLGVEPSSDIDKPLDSQSSSSLESQSMTSSIG